MVSSLITYPFKMLHPLYQRSSFHRGVIEEVGDPELRKAYSFCRGITREYAKTFYFATRFLPRNKQRGIFAIYALCRYMDNLVDNTEDLVRNNELRKEDLPEIIADWKIRLVETFRGIPSDNPILIALSDVLRQYNIRIDFPLDLLDGVSMDLTKNRYANFDELYVYCYKVASVVGLMTSEIFTYEEKAALEYAEALGIAMQLTNILRDVKEDAAMGRIYLPQDEMKQFGVTEQQLFENRLDDNLVSLLKFQIQRARAYYAEADKGIPMLGRDSRLPVALARYNYARILDRIEEMDYNVFSGRARLSAGQKLQSLPRAALRIF